MGTAVMKRRVVKQLVVVAASLVALAAASTAGASPARAGGDGSLLGCGHQATHPFLRWLDPLPYTLLPGGDFESGAAGWKLSGGARVVDGNEPFRASGGGSRSLLLPPGSSATSPPMCMGLLLPVVRWFSTGGNLLSYLRVEAVYADPSGRQRSIDLLPGGLPTRSWAPSLPALQLMGLLNVLTLDGLTSNIALRFTPKGTLFGSGTWRIDDVYVDPWKVI
jgi:hypothetical protein